MTIVREYAEQQYAEELRELAKADARPRPPNWRLSPWAVSAYILRYTASRPWLCAQSAGRARRPAA